MGLAQKVIFLLARRFSRVPRRGANPARDHAVVVVGDNIWQHFLKIFDTHLQASAHTETRAHRDHQAKRKGLGVSVGFRCVGRRLRWLPSTVARSSSLSCPLVVVVVVVLAAVAAFGGRSNDRCLLVCLLPPAHTHTHSQALKQQIILSNIDRNNCILSPDPTAASQRW